MNGPTPALLSSNWICQLIQNYGRTTGIQSNSGASAYACVLYKSRLMETRYYSPKISLPGLSRGWRRGGSDRHALAVIYVYCCIMYWLAISSSSIRYLIATTGLYKQGGQIISLLVDSPSFSIFSPHCSFCVTPKYTQLKPAVSKQFPSPTVVAAAFSDINVPSTNASLLSYHLSSYAFAVV